MHQLKFHFEGKSLKFVFVSLRCIAAEKILVEKLKILVKKLKILVICSVIHTIFFVATVRILKNLLEFICSFEKNI